MEGEIRKKRDLEKIKKDLEIKLEKLDAEKKKLAKESSAQINSLKTEITAKDIEIDKLLTRVDEFDKRVFEEKSKNSYYEKQISNLNEEMSKLETKIKEMSQFDPAEVELREKVAKMKEKGIMSLVAKLDQCMRSLESNFMCFLCMDVFKEPITVTKCGHNYCKGCYQDHRITECPKCNKAVTGTVEDELMQDVVNKFLYQQKAVEAFKNEDIWKDNAMAVMSEKNK